LARPALIGTRAKAADFAGGAIGLASKAAAAAMPDEPVAKVCPLGPWNELHQVLFDLFGRGLFRQAESRGESLHVGIDDHAFVDVEGIAKDDVGGFATDAGERRERGHVAGNLAVVPRYKCGATGADVFRLGAEKACRADQVLKLLRGQGHVIGGAAADAEEFRSHEVHTLVGALRGKDRGDEEFERISVVEFAVRIGIDVRESFDEGGGPRGARHFFFPGTGVAGGGPRAASRSFAFSANSESGYLVMRSL